MADDRRAQMFPALAGEDVARLAAFGVEQAFEDRALVFSRGDRDVPFFVVLEGEMEIVHPRGHAEDLVTVHGPRELTGEASLILDRPLLVFGRAKVSLRVLRIENARFRSLLQTDAALSSSLRAWEDTGQREPANVFCHQFAPAGGGSLAS